MRRCDHPDRRPVTIYDHHEQGTISMRWTVCARCWAQLTPTIIDAQGTLNP